MLSNLHTKGGFFVFMQAIENERPSSEVRDPRTKWENSFVETAKYQGGHCYGWVYEGVKRGLADDSTEGRLELARQMGGVFSTAFDEKTGAEAPLEKLNLEQTAQVLGLEFELIRDVALLMVDVGVLRSERTEAKDRIIQI